MKRSSDLSPSTLGGENGVEDDRDDEQGGLEVALQAAGRKKRTDAGRRVQIDGRATAAATLRGPTIRRRGGMLIHGAIIARELGVPCVNGVPDAVEQLPDGQVVTVDGYLGIVTVGPPDFDLELAARR